MDAVVGVSAGCGVMGTMMYSTAHRQESLPTYALLRTPTCLCLGGRCLRQCSGYLAKDELATMDAKLRWTYDVDISALHKDALRYKALLAAQIDGRCAGLAALLEVDDHAVVAFLTACDVRADLLHWHFHVLDLLAEHHGVHELFGWNAADGLLNCFHCTDVLRLPVDDVCEFPLSANRLEQREGMCCGVSTRSITLDQADRYGHFISINNPVHVAHCSFC